MKEYTLQERIEIIKIHYKNGENLAENIFGSTWSTLSDRDKKLVENFELLGQVSDFKNETRARRSRTAEKIAAEAESAEENPGLPNPRRSLELGISQTSLHRILHEDLGLKAYIVKLTQELKPADHQQRRFFAGWVVEMHDNDPEFREFHRKIILSDEAHFHHGGFVNKQNCRIWGSENPRVIVEKPFYPQRVTVWCGLGPLEEKIWANSPASIQDFKDGIRKAIEDIGQPLCDLVMENLIERIWFCHRDRCGYLPDVNIHF